MPSSLSIITPWLDHPEFLDDYAAAVAGADEVIVIDNGSAPEPAAALRDACAAHGWRLLRSEANLWFGPASNWGLQEAAGDILVCLNNDVRAAGAWLSLVRRDTIPGALCGPGVAAQRVAGVEVPYVEGWCVAAHRAVWQALGGFDTETYERCYYEDADLSWRAAVAGLQLIQTDWPIAHIANGTSATLPEAHAATARNRIRFAARVRELRAQGVRG